MKEFNGELSGKPLDCGMSNDDAYKLGQLTNEAAKYEKVGDFIDRGLVLRRLLAENGFYIIKSGIKEPKA